MGFVRDTDGVNEAVHAHSVSSSLPLFNVLIPHPCPAQVTKTVSCLRSLSLGKVTPIQQ